MAAADPVACEWLLTSASRLFYARGIRAVGVDLIAEEAGTTKKTLYDRFGSKDALVARYLETRAMRWRRYLEGYLAEHAPEPGVDRVLAVFGAIGEWMAGLDRGCAFVNAYAEIGGAEHPGVAVIRDEKQWMLGRFRALAEEAGIDDR